MKKQIEKGSQLRIRVDEIKKELFEELDQDPLCRGWEAHNLVNAFFILKIASLDIKIEEMVTELNSIQKD